MDKELQKTIVLHPDTMEHVPCIYSSLSTLTSATISPVLLRLFLYRVHKEFTFDYSYNSFTDAEDWDYASNKTVWEDLGMASLEKAWSGFNVSLFAYGQTGSGKSHSMMGYPGDEGIVPRACQEIFRRIEESAKLKEEWTAKEKEREEKFKADREAAVKAAEEAGEAPPPPEEFKEAEDIPEDVALNLTFKVTCSMLEIYNERVRDLFDMKKGGAGGLKVRTHKKKGPYADGLSQEPCAHYEMVEKLMKRGIRARTVAATAMNATSSRAHTIFQIIMTQTRVDKKKAKAMDRVSTISLIDLAGSERQSKTGASGDRLKEGCAINQSLSALGNVIKTLADKATKPKNKKVQKRVVPYRSSKLTHLLQNSLGGNAKTIMIAAIAPSNVNFEETMSTLRYADRAKQIKNKARVNEDPNVKLIRGLKQEIEMLRKQLKNAAMGIDMEAQQAAMKDMLEKEKQEWLKKYEAEKASEMERIKAEMMANEKKQKEEQMTWEERIKEAENRAKQQEENMKKMGLAFDDESVVEKRRRTPHLVNLHEDKALSEKLVFFLDEGITRFGRTGAAHEPDVILTGLNIKAEHCIIQNNLQELIEVPVEGEGKKADEERPAEDTKGLQRTKSRLTMPAKRAEGDGEVKITAINNSKTYVNGTPVPPEGMVLHHGFRIIIGNSYVFRIEIPLEAARRKEKHADDFGEKLDLDKTEEDEAMRVSYEQAMKEMHAAQMEAMVDKEARAKAEEEERQMKEQIEKLKEQMEQEKKKQAEMEKKFEGKSEDEKKVLLQAQKDLEAKLAQQIAETERLQSAKQREIKQRSLLDQKLQRIIPLVKEANAMSEELDKSAKFRIKLRAVRKQSVANDAPASPAAGGGGGGDSEAFSESQVWVQAEYPDRVPVQWNEDKFMNRLYMMREMYQAFEEGGRDLECKELQAWDEDKDPFFDPPDDTQLLGKAAVYLSALYYLVDVEENVPIIDYKGKCNGELQMKVFFDIDLDALLEGVGDIDADADITLHMFVGRKLPLVVECKGARGLPANLCSQVFCKYRWWLETEERRSEQAEGRHMNPQLNFVQRLEEMVVTKEFVDWLERGYIDVEVLGSASIDAPCG